MRVVHGSGQSGDTPNAHHYYRNVPDSIPDTAPLPVQPVTSFSSPTVIFTGEDGHLYLTADEGRRKHRLSWKNEDFSMWPGIPALPGAAGDLEDDWHFTQPTPSPDGTRVAAFGLLAATPEELAEMELGGVDEFESIEAYGDPSIEEHHEEPLWVPESNEDDVAGPGLLPISLPEGKVIAVPLGAMAEPEDPEETAYWPGARVYVMHRDGVQIWEAWGFDDGGPIHLGWSPSGEQLLVLHQSGESLELRLIDPSDEEPRLIARGAPIFWQWQPDGPRLALRVTDPGGRGPTLRIARPGEPGGARFVDDAGSFYSPAWRPDGSSFVYGSAGDREDRVVLAEPDGQPLADLIGYPGRAAFKWSPDGSRLAVPISPEGTGAFLALELLDVDSGVSRTLHQEPFLAMSWLPDASGILLCAVNSDTGKLRWVRLHLDGSSRPVGPPFSPSQETLASLHFFDQAADDRPFLSHDGSAVVWAGVPAEPVVSTTTALAADPRDDVPRILLAPLDGRPTLAIGTGRYACFPPVPPRR